MFSSTPGARIDRRVDEQFIDLICADDELMQAEFDEIVAAEWAVPPPVDSTCAATADGRATGGDHRPRAPRSRTETREPFPTSSGLVFARSPPVAPRPRHHGPAVRRRGDSHPARAFETRVLPVNGTRAQSAPPRERAGWLPSSPRRAADPHPRGAPMSNDRYLLQQLTPIEWIVVDTSRGPGDPYRTVACLYETDGSEYDTIWLQDLGLPATWASPQEALQAIRLHSGRSTRIPSRTPIPIPHRHPVRVPAFADGAAPSVA